MRCGNPQCVSNRICAVMKANPWGPVVSWETDQQQYVQHSNKPREWYNADKEAHLAKFIQPADFDDQIRNFRGHKVSELHFSHHAFEKDIFQKCSGYSCLPSTQISQNASCVHALSLHHKKDIWTRRKIDIVCSCKAGLDRYTGPCLLSRSIDNGQVQRGRLAHSTAAWPKFAVLVRTLKFLTNTGWPLSLSLYEKLAILNADETTLQPKISCFAWSWRRKIIDSPSMSSPKLVLLSRQCSSFSCKRSPVLSKAWQQ